LLLLFFVSQDLLLVGLLRGAAYSQGDASRAGAQRPAGSASVDPRVEFNNISCRRSENGTLTISFRDPESGDTLSPKVPDPLLRDVAVVVDGRTISLCP
jgi:hypothetical protein